MKCKKSKETLEDLKEIVFVNMAKELLECSVQSSDVLRKKKYTPESLKEAKLTLGYLNAFLNAYKTRLQFFKLTGVDKKIAMVRKLSKKSL